MKKLVTYKVIPTKQAESLPIITTYTIFKSLEVPIFYSSVPELQAKQRAVEEYQQASIDLTMPPVIVDFSAVLNRPYDITSTAECDEIEHLTAELTERLDGFALKVCETCLGLLNLREDDTKRAVDHICGRGHLAFRDLRIQLAKFQISQPLGNSEQIPINWDDKDNVVINSDYMRFEFQKHKQEQQSKSEQIDMGDNQLETTKQLTVHPWAEWAQKYVLLSEEKLIQERVRTLKMAEHLRQGNILNNLNNQLTLPVPNILDHLINTYNNNTKTITPTPVSCLGVFESNQTSDTNKTLDTFHSCGDVSYNLLNLSRKANALRILSNANIVGNAFMDHNSYTDQNNTLRRQLPPPSPQSTQRFRHNNSHP